MIKSLYKLSVFAILLTSVVVILGAYTRLTDAGLGCPDWPGCYGFLSVPSSEADVQTATEAFPGRPLEPAKAWNEMIHRYFAGTLGLVILAMFIMSIRARVKLALPGVLLFTVTFQAILGMLTVTMNLMPLVVMGHLLGGFTTFCLLVLFNRRLAKQLDTRLFSNISIPSRAWVRFFQLSFVVLILQIALGGWTAANYAAVACTELPICESGWQQKFSLNQALTVPTGHADYEYGVLPYEARMSIHVLHRFGAILTVLVIAATALKLLSQPGLKPFGTALLILVTVQFLLGVSNVYFYLPLAVAVSHNFVALCLLATFCAMLYQVSSLRRVAEPRYNRHTKYTQLA